MRAIREAGAKRRLSLPGPAGQPLTSADTLPDGYERDVVPVANGAPPATPSPLHAIVIDDEHQSADGGEQKWPQPADG
jgi:hypothetical protein